MTARLAGQKSKRSFSALALWLSSTSLIVSGCGGGHNPDLARPEQSHKLGACEVKELMGPAEESRLSFSVQDADQGRLQSIEGIGQVLFLCPLEQVGGQHSFELSFELDEGGSVTLISFANGKLQHGFELEWQRQGEELTVLARSGAAEQNWSGPLENTNHRRAPGFFSTLQANEPQAFTLDVHNWETPAHILIWQGLRDSQRKTPQSALFNSATDTMELKSHYLTDSPGNGQGRLWGLRLDGARVTGANFAKPVAGH